MFSRRHDQAPQRAIDRSKLISRFPVEKPEQSLKFDLEYDENASLISLVDEESLLCEEGWGSESASDNSQSTGSSSSALPLPVTSGVNNFSGLHFRPSSLAIFRRTRKQ